LIKNAELLPEEARRLKLHEERMRSEAALKAIKKTNTSVPVKARQSKVLKRENTVSLKKEGSSDSLSLLHPKKSMQHLQITHEESSSSRATSEAQSAYAKESGEGKRKKSAGKKKTKKKNTAKIISPENLNVDLQEKDLNTVAFYQPLSLKDYEAMVEFDSDFEDGALEAK